MIDTEGWKPLYPVGVWGGVGSLEKSKVLDWLESIAVSLAVLPGLRTWDRPGLRRPQGKQGHL